MALELSDECGEGEMFGSHCTRTTTHDECEAESDEEEEGFACLSSDVSDVSAATTPPRGKPTIFSKRKPKGLGVCVADELEGGGSSMWSPSTGIDDLFSGQIAASHQPSSAHLVKSKTPTSLTVLLDGQQGFVDAGTPSLRICMSEVLQTESDQHMSAADVASMMCFTLSSPPKSARRNAGANALCV